MNIEVSRDEEILLQRFRDAKAMKWSDMTISIEAGQIAKLWITEKTDVAVLKGALRSKDQPS